MTSRYLFEKMKQDKILLDNTRLAILELQGHAIGKRDMMAYIKSNELVIKRLIEIQKMGEILGDRSIDRDFRKFIKQLNKKFTNGKTHWLNSLPIKEKRKSPINYVILTTFERNFTFKNKEDLEINLKKIKKNPELISDKIITYSKINFGYSLNEKQILILNKKIIEIIRKYKVDLHFNRINEVFRKKLPRKISQNGESINPKLFKKYRDARRKA